MEPRIGTVMHYYLKRIVAAIILQDRLAKGEKIHIRGEYENFHQTITLIEYKHTPIAEANEGLDISIKIVQRDHEDNIVLKEM